MRARAPAIGAERRLLGARRAPALVAAVDRYAVADASREPDLVTAEVAEAVRRVTWRARRGSTRAPARDLPNGTSRKLGLGSSAAILVASMAASDSESEAARASPSEFFRARSPAIARRKAAEAASMSRRARTVASSPAA